MHSVQIGSSRITPGGGLPLWPLTIAFTGYVVFWAVGIPWLVWPLMALPMFVNLALCKNARVPPGFNGWLLFVAVVIASASMIEGGASGWIQWAYNLGEYLCATVFFAYTYNVNAAADRVIPLLARFWAVAIVCGILGMLLPHFQMQAPAAHVIPPGLRDNEFIKSTLNIRFASVDNLVGVPRPSAPFPYSNRWGAVVLLTLPAATWYVFRMRRPRSVVWIAIFVVSIVPIVYSQNRGLWIGMAVAGMYLAMRALREGNIGRMAAIIMIFVLVALLGYVTGLTSIVLAKFNSHYSSDARSSIYGLTWDAFKQKPWIGHGTSGTATGNVVGGVAVGSQGQLWALMYSTGVSGLVTFYGWLLWSFGYSRKDSGAMGTVLRLPLLLAACVSVVYAFVPESMVIIVVSLACVLAAKRGSVSWPQTRRSPNGPLAIGAVNPAASPGALQGGGSK